MHLHHQRHIDRLVRSRLEQIDFPTPVLLGRCAQKLHAPIDPEPLHRIRKSHKPGHRSRGDEIVTTRMADPRKCIVLCVEVDGPAAASTDDLEGRLQTVRMPRDLVSEIFYKLADGIVGFVFFVREFGILEDLCRR